MCLFSMKFTFEESLVKQFEIDLDVDGTCPYEIIGNDTESNTGS